MCIQVPPANSTSTSILHAEQYNLEAWWGVCRIRIKVSLIILPLIISANASIQEDNFALLTKAARRYLTGATPMQVLSNGQLSTATASTKSCK
jgi:hypothetical protein